MSSAGFHKFKDAPLDKIRPFWHRVKEDTTIEAAGKKATRPITKKIVLQTNRNTYTLVDLMLLVALWAMRLFTLFCVCYFIYDRIGVSLCAKM